MKKLALILLGVFFLSAQTSNNYVLLDENSTFKVDFSFSSIVLENFIPEQELLSGIYRLNADFQINSTTSAYTEIPFIYSDYILDIYDNGPDHPPFKESIDASSFGNIKFGFRSIISESASSKKIFDISVRIPTMEEANSIQDFILISFPSLYSDLINIDRFAYHVLTFSTSVLSNSNFGNSYLLSNFGFKYLMDTSEQKADSELFLKYGGEYKYLFEIIPINLSLRVRGIMILTEDIESFKDRFIHAIEPNIEVQLNDKYKLYLEYNKYINNDFNYNVSSIYTFGFVSTF
jgi:hypothetical protein